MNEIIERVRFARVNSFQDVIVSSDNKNTFVSDSIASTSRFIHLDQVLEKVRLAPMDDTVDAYKGLSIVIFPGKHSAEIKGAFAKAAFSS